MKQRDWDEEDLQKLKEDFELSDSFVIPKSDIQTIKYFIDDWMRLMGFGGEYNKLLKLAESLRESGVDFSDSHYVKYALNSADRSKKARKYFGIEMK